MPPIGILTKNRAAYLDVTLRSLSATDIPAGVSVTVFDDASTDAATLQYYRKSGTTKLAYNTWPQDSRWQALGLGQLPTGKLEQASIGDKIHVHRAKRPAGVVKASCTAIRSMLESSSAAGVFLLQDDVVFNADWYHRMLRTVAESTNFTERPIGVLAGLKLNHTLWPEAGKLAVPSGITAQCLYISRQAAECVDFLTNPPNVTKRFDDLLRRAVTKAGLWGGVIYPFVCQHIGVKSLVRPGKRWGTGKAARVGLYSHPPYTMSDSVRSFRDSRDE